MPFEKRCRDIASRRDQNARGGREQRAEQVLGVEALCDVLQCVRVVGCAVVVCEMMKKKAGKIQNPKSCRVCSFGCVVTVPVILSLVRVES